MRIRDRGSDPGFCVFPPGVPLPDRLHGSCGPGIGRRHGRPLLCGNALHPPPQVFFGHAGDPLCLLSGEVHVALAYLELRDVHVVSLLREKKDGRSSTWRNGRFGLRLIVCTALYYPTTCRPL
jgi:hypothetical protein